MISDLSDSDPRQIGPYRLLGRLGSGGMGVVYLASSPTEDVVAVKLIRADLAQDAAFRARFTREVDAARRVGGICTARVRDVDLDGDRPWVVTDYVAGPNLAELVARHGPLPADQQRALAVGLAEALDAVHAAGVVHRDLKPTNVLCSPAGPRLIDFGIAQAADATSATLTGQLVGSPAWMAPEQIRGQPATPAVDLFALGSVLVFAGTGRPPFGQGQIEAVMYRILNEAPDLGSGGALAPELVPIVDALLAKEPAARPGPGQILAELAGTSADRAGAVTAVLDRTWALPTGELVAVADATPPATAARTRRRRWKGVTATAAAVAAVVLIAAFLLAKPDHGHKLQAAPTTRAKTTFSATTTRSDPTPTTPTTARRTTVPPTTAAPTTTTLSTVPPITAPPTTTPPTTTPATVPPTTTAPAAAPPPSTEVLIYDPYDATGDLATDIDVTATDTGYCWGGSDAAPRSDAWRCMDGNEIMDPCFANVPGSQVACPASDNPYAVTVLELTQPLPTNLANQENSSGGPWMFQLADGAYCTPDTGATFTIDGMRESGGCTDRTDWFDNVDQTTDPWTVLAQVPGQSVLKRVDISKAWE